MLLIQDPETSIIINLDAAETFNQKHADQIVVRMPGTRYVAIHGLTCEMLAEYNIKNNGRIKLHTIEPLNFERW